MKNFLLFWWLVLGSGALQAAYAQNRTVQGVVRDVTGPIPGVTVVEKGLMENGTATDLNGQYTITLRGSSGVLLYRGLNYKLTEVLVGSRSTVNVTLENAQQALDEVTVVGYGEQKKITQTGAVSQISGQAIRENPSASLQNSLVGRLPGFFAQQTSGRPGNDGAQFFIRGVSSYNSGANQPLIIVDDIQYDYNQFQRLDPNEIESVSVLKDAATTAIYGVRGANGVIVVTTRRGKNGPPQISGRFETGFAQPTKLPTYLNAYESARLFNQAQVNDNNNQTTPVANFQPLFSDSDLEQFRNGGAPAGYGNVDWRKELFRDWSQQYRANIDISGGSERVKYFTSVGYLNQQGMLKDFGNDGGVNNNYYQQRYNYRSNLDLNVARGLDMRVDLYGNVARVNIPNAGGLYNDVFFDYSSWGTLAPFAYPIRTPDGQFAYSTWAQSSLNRTFDVNNVVGRYTYGGYDRNFENNINGILSLKQDLGVFSGMLKGLSVLGRAAYTSNYSYLRSATRSGFPSFIYNATTGAYDIPRTADVYRVPGYNLGYDTRSTTRSLSLQGILNYARSFGKHDVSGLLLYNRNVNTAQSGDANYNFVPNNFLGSSLRLGYDYDERYLFQFNAGYNGSSRFAEDNRYGFFPAVSAGWNIAEEAFFKQAVPVINLLKLRGSYGLVGNDQLGNGFSYYYVQNYNPSNSNVTLNTNNNFLQPNFGLTSAGYNGIAEGTLPANVTWEKERKLDVALEFRLLKNTVSGSVDYFRNNRYDILTNISSTIPIVFGAGAAGGNLPPANIGQVRNQGVEVELGYQSDVRRPFSFSIRGNYSLAKNIILFQNEAPSDQSYQLYTGKSIGQQLLYISDPNHRYYTREDIANPSVPKPASGAVAGDLRYQDLNGDGRIDGLDRSVTGNPSLPNTTYGVNVGARYKGLSVSILFQGASNFSVAAADQAINAFSSNLTAIHQQAWTPELGEAATYPRLSLTGIGGTISNPSNRSTYWQVPGDYVRLKNIQLNYDLPASLLNKLGMPSARLYASGTNLFTWTKASSLYDFDPEISFNAGRVSYPPQRLLNLGMSVTF